MSGPTDFETIAALPKALEALQGRRCVVFGLGREGSSTARFLSRYLPENELVLTDEALESEGQATVVTQRVAREGVPGLVLPPARVVADPNTVIFRAPGIPPHNERLQTWLAAGATLHSSTQLLFELINTLPTPPITIGVTGTKGKSTTTAVIAHILKSAGKTVLLGGNIGVPPLELWEQLREPIPQALIVLELSAHQLVDLDHSPHFAVVQDITPEHLDYYHDFASYKQAKSHLVRHQLPTDFVIFNPALTTPSELASTSPATPLHFSLKQQPQTDEKLLCCVVDGSITYQNDTIIKASELPLTGEHNLLNVMPGVIIAKQLGVPSEAIATALRTFAPLPHRLQFVATHSQVEYYNDSLATAPEAACAAITSFHPRPIVLLAGGTERNLDLSGLVRCVVDHSVRALVLFPPTGETIAKQLQALDAQLPFTVVRSMADAVKQARLYAAALPADERPVVLLSPGGASFPIFRDYADRGTQFTERALELD